MPSEAMPKVSDAVDAMSNKAGTWRYRMTHQATKSTWLPDLDGTLRTSECIMLDSWYVWHKQFFFVLNAFPEDVENKRTS